MKNASLTISPAALRKAAITFLQRFHLVLFVVVALGGLATAIFTLNNVVVGSAEAPNNSSSAAGFDKATMERIDQLKTQAQDSGELDLSKGRSNPFVE